MEKASNLVSSEKNEVNKVSVDHVELLKQASAASNEDVLQLRKLIADLPELPQDYVEAAKVVRLYLIDQGFDYDPGVYSLKEILEKKAGNCLGLNLLFGAILYERGHTSLSFKMIMHPDTAKRADEIAFQHFYEGIDYENPTLPRREDIGEHNINHFLPLEHPLMFVAGQPFDVTFIGEGSIDEDPIYLPKFEASQDITFAELISCVYVERSHRVPLNSTDKKQKEEAFLEIKRLLEQGLELWDSNREGWCALWSVAVDLGDKDIQVLALKKYMELGGTDSRYMFNMYVMTKDTKYLDLALEKFPQYIMAFFEKHVVLEKNLKEAKADLAVVAWCISRSAYISLADFYNHPEVKQKLIELFGIDSIKQLEGVGADGGQTPIYS